MALALDGTPKEQLAAAIASLRTLETEFEAYSSKGGDEARRARASGRSGMKL